MALKSVERARQIAERTPDAREAHVGYYLIGAGRPQFERGHRMGAGTRASGCRRAFSGTPRSATSARSRWARRRLVATAIALRLRARLAMADAGGRSFC